MIKFNLVKSFNHFWYDLDACANKIRQVIELIVDEKKGKGPTLHAKILSLKSELGDSLVKKLLAIKCIGNDGSHTDRLFERVELLDTYCILVDIFDQLWPDHSERLRRENLVEAITLNKGLKASGPS